VTDYEAQLTGRLGGSSRAQGGKAGEQGGDDGESEHAEFRPMSKASFRMIRGGRFVRDPKMNKTLDKTVARGTWKGIDLRLYTLDPRSTSHLHRRRSKSPRLQVEVDHVRCATCNDRYFFVLGSN